MNKKNMNKNMNKKKLNINNKSSCSKVIAGVDWKIFVLIRFWSYFQVTMETKRKRKLKYTDHSFSLLDF